MMKYIPSLGKIDLLFIYLCIGMLLVSRSGLVHENAVEVYNHYSVHLSSSPLM